MDAILDEDFFKLGDLPIMVCVLSFAEGFSVGYSASRLGRYDDELARFHARRAAVRHREAFEQKRSVRGVA